MTPQPNRPRTDTIQEGVEAIMADPAIIEVQREGQVLENMAEQAWQQQQQQARHQKQQHEHTNKKVGFREPVTKPWMFAVLRVCGVSVGKHN